MKECLLLRPSFLVFASYETSPIGACKSRNFLIPKRYAFLRIFPDCFCEAFLKHHKRVEEQSNFSFIQTFMKYFICILLWFLLEPLCAQTDQFHSSLALENYKKKRTIEIPFGESLYLKMGDDWHRGIFMGISSKEIIFTSDTISLSSIEALSVGAPKSLEEGLVFSASGLAAATVFTGLLFQSYNSGNDVLYVVSSYGIVFSGAAFLYGIYRMTAGGYNRLVGKGTYRIGQKWSIGPSYNDEPILK